MGGRGGVAACIRLIQHPKTPFDSPTHSTIKAGN